MHVPTSISCTIARHNKNFTPCGEPYSLRFGDWKGARVGLYSYNTLRDGGNAFFNWFTYDFN